jgi:hypothetical protein
MKRLVPLGLALFAALSLGACAAYDQSQPVAYAYAPPPQPVPYAYAPAPSYYSYYPGYYYSPYPAYYGPRTSLSFGYYSGRGGHRHRW